MSGARNITRAARVRLSDLQHVMLTRMRTIFRADRGETEPARAQHEALADIKRDVVLLLSDPDVMRVRRPSLDELRDFAARVEAMRSGAVAVELWTRFCELLGPGRFESSDHIRLQAEADHILISVGDGAVPPSEPDDEHFVEGAMALIARARARARAPTVDEGLVLGLSYRLVAHGARLPRRFHTLGKSGFRAHQTCLSLADPGPDHVEITSRLEERLDGTVVHIEYIHRDGVADKDQVEAYRLSGLPFAARVRIHVGDSAPVTAYVGRPVFENYAGGEKDNYFSLDLLKTAHMTAAACSALYQLGIADCKIAVERMTFRQAVKFVSTVVGNLIRDRYRQTLCIAMNLNTPFVFDEGEGETRRIAPLEDPATRARASMELAQLGIRIAAGGGADKIAWDGASHEQPSKPFVEQVAFEDLVTLAHQAHSAGLETYISAGMTPEHMRTACFAGIGGVGIGTSMRIDGKTNAAMDPAAIRRALQVRDEAELDPRGRQARLLARLDMSHSEGTLLENEAKLRKELFEAVKAGRDVWAELEPRAKRMLALPDDGPWTDRASSSLARLVAVTAADQSLRDDQQREVLERLMDVVRRGDPEGAAAEISAARRVAKDQIDPFLRKQIEERRDEMKRLLSTGRLEEAAVRLEALQATAEFHPEIDRQLADLYGMLGGGLRRARRYEEAIAAYDDGYVHEQRIGKVPSTYTRVQRLVNRILHRPEAWSEEVAVPALPEGGSLRAALSAAQATIRDQLRLSRSDSWVWADLAIVSYLLGEDEDGRRALEQFVCESPFGVEGTAKVFRELAATRIPPSEKLREAADFLESWRGA